MKRYLILSLFCIGTINIQSEEFVAVKMVGYNSLNNRFEQCCAKRNKKDKDNCLKALQADTEKEMQTSGNLLMSAIASGLTYNFIMNQLNNNCCDCKNIKIGLDAAHCFVAVGGLGNLLLANYLKDKIDK